MTGHGAGVDAGTPHAGASDLERVVERWIRMEAGDREPAARIGPALDGIREFIAGRRAELERRQARLLQTSGFRDETQAMAGALARIEKLLAAGRNVTAIFAAIDAFLERYRGEASFDREGIQVRLAAARDDQICRIHEALRGTRLAPLLDVLFFLPYSSWRARGAERRCFRSPPAVEIRQVLAACRRAGVDVDAADPVALAVLVRVRLGIAPRMDVRRLAGNKLAERLVDEELLRRMASPDPALDRTVWRSVEVLLADLRRWSAACFGELPVAASPEVEAEMLQIALGAGELLQLGGAGTERQADFLWLLATVVAGDHEMLADILARLFDRHGAHPAVRERITAARRHLDAVTPVADAILAARWSEARRELDEVVGRCEALLAREALTFADYTELAALKERRSDVVKSVIKLSESLALLEPALRTAPGDGSRPVDPARLRDRNLRIAGETAALAREELERLRTLIARMTALSRKGFEDAGPPPGGERRREPRRPLRLASDGVDLGTLSSAELEERRRSGLAAAALALRELRTKLEVVRRRSVRSELTHAVNALCERSRRAADACEGAAPAEGAAPRPPADPEGVVAALRDVMAAQANLGARLGSAKLAPAERTPVTAVILFAKTRIGEVLRDLECLVAAATGRPGAAVAAGPPIAGLVAGANRALAGCDPAAPDLARALEALRAGVRGARQTLASTGAEGEGGGANDGPAAPGGPEAIGSQRELLACAEAESGRLLAVGAALEAVREAREAAAAHERGLAETLRPPDGARPPGPFVPIRERCAQALAAMPGHEACVREARDRLADAAGASWGVLQEAPAFLAGCAAALAAAEGDLRAIRARVEGVHDRFRADRPRPR